MAAPQEVPVKNHSFRDFGGINTQANRENIGDDEFAWLENVMPIGDGNMPALYGPVDTAISLSGATCYNMWDANIANVDYMFMFCTDGSAFQVNLSSLAVVKFANAGKFNGSSTRIAQWANDRILIIDSSGYYDWNAAVLTSLGGTTSAPSAGTTIAVFSGRVWIGNSRTVVYSAPNSYTDFQGVSFGGSFVIDDPTLHSTIKQMLSANGFLYIVGQDSVNVVSDVRVSSSTTVFSNLNLVTTVGTVWPDSVIAYYRTIWLAAKYGFYGITGATATKGSDDLDGIFPNILTTQAITSGTVILNNILCLVYLFKYQDTASQRYVMAIHFNKKWFLASQGITLTDIATASPSGVPTLYGTDGTKLYKLFSDTTNTTTPTQIIKTRLWDMGAPLQVKQALKVGIEVISPTNLVTITGTVDTEYATTPISFSAQNVVSWVNNLNAVVLWQNNTLQIVAWAVAGYLFPKSNIDAYGNYVGVTLNSTTAGVTYAGIHLQYKLSTPWWSPA